MRPAFQLLDAALVERILAEAFELLRNPGIRVSSTLAARLLGEAGSEVKDGVARIPEALVRGALQTAPQDFCLYDRRQRPVVHYGSNDVHFDPGSSCLNILDAETQTPRAARSSDLVRLVEVAEMLPQYAAQSTAMVCSDVPSEIGDWYRLLVVLWHSEKPVVTGAFSVQTLGTMLELLAAESGGAEALKARPRAVFDVCPSPPLHWSEFASENLIVLARAGVPAELISMPLAGATAPVTLAGAMVQHAAESLAGVSIHQLANAGAPVVWGGAPAIFDMSTGNTPMGAIETAMLNLGCTQIGKALGLPTHGYLAATDGKHLDAQAGMESGVSATLGALAGINMISGAGMLDFLACHSIEKLVLDAEAIASAERLLAGVSAQTRSFALDAFRQTGHTGEFLKLPETRTLFRSEQHFPSEVIDRGGDPNAPDILARARLRVEELVAGYQRPQIAPEVEQTLLTVAHQHARKAGLKHLPGLEPQPVAV
jgi:trimethylamine--corrinoid protein Co-methyltransferase